MQRHEVLLTGDAAGDLDELFDSIVESESPAAARQVLDGLEQAIAGLRTFPEHGSFPEELLALGIRDYRQVFFEPYHLIYRRVGTRVYIYLIVDGRREIQAVLARRLLGA